MQVKFGFFRGSLASWDELFSQAAKLATEVGRDRVINISHAVAGSDGTVTVWYWAESGEEV